MVEYARKTSKPIIAMKIPAAAREAITAIR
jgi:hypothetical protein